MVIPNLLATFKEWVPYPLYQGIALVVLIGLIIAFIVYRRRQK